tara:strand:+ start:142 stop:315 length:174 start_codon:yes stop_codon:yes gene_type:complete
MKKDSVLNNLKSTKILRKRNLYFLDIKKELDEINKTKIKIKSRNKSALFISEPVKNI